MKDGGSKFTLETTEFEATIDINNEKDILDKKRK